MLVVSLFFFLLEITGSGQTWPPEEMLWFSDRCTQRNVLGPWGL